MSLEVPGGTYYRSYKSGADGCATVEANPATMSGFRLDKYAVTVGRFRQFVNAWKGGKGWMPARGSGKHARLNGGKGLRAVGGGYEAGWDVADGRNVAPTNTHLTECESDSTWTAAAGIRENLPINCVTWQEAYAFCIWDGGALPSEAEWGYTAAGGDEQRMYPWGSTDPGTNNQYGIYACLYPSGSDGRCNGATNVAPTGSATLGAGRWGQLDLAGNIGAWVRDAYASYAVPCADCANLKRKQGATTQAIRGGYWNGGDASNLMPPFRALLVSTQRHVDSGIRCARSSLASAVPTEPVPSASPLLHCGSRGGVHDLLALIERFGCDDGPCPVYTATAYRDGTVEYFGEEWVKVKGPATGQLSSDELAALEKLFLDNGYLRLADVYEDAKVMERPTATTSYSAGGRTKTVYHQWRAPAALKAVEQGIDRILHVERWVGTAAAP